jgi:MFS transporter, putative metabolite:H+ symporter
MKNRDHGYSMFVTLIAFLGWTISAMDTSIFFFVAPNIMEEFDFSLIDFGIIVAEGFIVAILFNIVVGPLMDYFGRKVVFQWILLLVTIGTFLTGLSWNFESLTFFRILATGSAFAEYAIGATILIESVSAKHRGWNVGIMAAGWPVGTAISTLISIYIVPEWGWRSAFYLASIPAFLIIVIRMFIKEPERSKELVKLRKNIKSSTSVTNEIVASTRFKINKEEVAKFTYLQLMKGELLKNTIFIWIYMNLVVISYGLLIWFAPYWMNYAFQLNWNEATWTVGAGSIISVLGFISCGWLSGMIGIRYTNLLFIMTSIPATIWMACFADTFSVFLPAYLLWNFFGAGIWGAIPRIFTEAFPTRVRGTGSSISSASCWLGWAIISYLAPHIIEANGYYTAILFSGTILLPLALIPLWMIQEIPSSQEMKDYIL